MFPSNIRKLKHIFRSYPMKEFTNETYYVDEGDNDSPGEGGPSVDFLFSVAVAAYILGGMVGSLLGGYVADKFGRQRGLLYVQVCAMF